MADGVRPKGAYSDARRHMRVLEWSDLITATHREEQKALRAEYKRRWRAKAKVVRGMKAAREQEAHAAMQQAADMLPEVA